MNLQNAEFHLILKPFEKYLAEGIALMPQNTSELEF